jgi:hypothetical protein
LDQLTFDPRNKVYSNLQNNLQIPEDLHNFWHFITGPYTVDGRNIYSLTHSEWYAGLLTGDLVITTDASDNVTITQTPCDPGLGRGVLYDSWTTTVNSVVSTDGGASWGLNWVNGNHVVADTSYKWTGSVALASRAYLHAQLWTGLQQISNIIKEGNYYYAMGNYYHRDFSQIDPAAGQYQAPIDKEGIIIIRSQDLTNPAGWEAWSGGTTYEPIANQNFKTFYPQKAGVPYSAWNPRMIYDTNARTYIVVFAGDWHNNNATVYYTTTNSLANPAWSDYALILGMGSGFIADPDVAPTDIHGCMYPTLIDKDSPGFNFEFTGGSPYLVYPSGQGILRLQLSISYSVPPPPPQFNIGDRVTVINGTHNIRTGPNSALPVVAQVPQDAQGTITAGPVADQNPAGPSGIGFFYQVTWDNPAYRTGWLYDITLALASPSPTPSPSSTRSGGGGGGGGACGATGLEFLIVLGVMAIRRRR